MEAIKRFFPMQPGTGAIEYAVVMAGVVLTIVAVIATNWLVVNQAP
jgi:Flp pilus assembly pilin Flp